jgi:hypothetical protein
MAPPAVLYGAANLQYVGTAIESVYGVAAAAPTTFHPADTPALKFVIPAFVDQALRGSQALDYASIQGMRHDSITFKTYGYIDSFFQLMRGALGLPDVITGSADPYTHKTSLQSGNNGQPAGTTVFYYDAMGKAWIMPGSVVQMVKITGAVGALLSLDVTYLGLPSIPSTPPTNTPSLTKPAPSWNSVITIGGVSYSKYSDFEITVNRAAEAILTVNGTQSPFAIFAGPLDVNGTLTAVYQGSTDNDLVSFLTNAQPAMTIKSSPVGDTVHGYTFQTSVVAYDDVAVAGNKWMELKATWKAMANTSDVAGGGNLSPLLFSMTSPVATAL